MIMKAPVGRIPAASRFHDREGFASGQTKYPFAMRCFVVVFDAAKSWIS
jgi:hypothetical protein